jgi:integrase
VISLSTSKPSMMPEYESRLRPGYSYGPHCSAQCRLNSRWGLHNLRHSLSNWLVNKAKENPKTVSGILGHSRIQTTLDLYTDEDLDEMIAAQEEFLDAVGFESGSIQ